MKKIISSVILGSVLLGTPMLASADNGKKSGNEHIKIEFRHTGDNHTNRDGKKVKATSTVNKIAKVTAAEITTYANVGTVLARLSTSTSALKFVATTTTTSTLNTGELTLFTKLSPGGTKAERVNAQADILLARISNLNNIVSTLGAQNVSTSFGLKGLVVRELNKIISEVNSLAKLSATLK